MILYRITQRNNDFLSMFDTSLEDIRERAKHKVIHPPETRPETLMLYRGINYLPQLNQNGKYVLSPEKSEQNVLWFTHKLIIRSINPVEYAEGHGKYLLTYPLNITKHIQKISYDDNNEVDERTPSEITDMSNGLENSRFYLGYELPEGWFFSYKHEKFIICNKSIEVDPSQISKVEVRNEDI